MNNGFYIAANGQRIDIAQQQKLAENKTSLYSSKQLDDLLRMQYPPQYQTIFQVKKSKNLL
jgi:hypothetical protein